MHIKTSQSGKLVYELARELISNPTRVAKTQALTLNKAKPFMGLSGNYGLFGSEEWWRSIDNGRIATQIHTGVIQDIYVAGMDGNEENNRDFQFLCDDQKIRTASCLANDSTDLSLYQIGSRVTIAYALDRLKEQPAEDGNTNFAKILLEIVIG